MAKALKKVSGQTPVASNRKVDYVQPPGGTPSIYSNHIQMGQTVFDVRIVFGEITDVTDEKIEVTKRAQVNLSWLEAKALKEFLSAYVAQYEEKNGPLKTEFETLTNPQLPTIPKIIDK